jgi:hypothetical protein
MFAKICSKNRLYGGHGEGYKTQTKNFALLQEQLPFRGQGRQWHHESGSARCEQKSDHAQP